MAKRKSRNTGEFKPPMRAQPRAKRQRSAEETTLQSADENQIQTPNSENNNSHNASCSEKLDEHQPGQISLTTEFPVDSCCSLEEKTCTDDKDKDGNGTNTPDVSREIEQTITVQTPEPNNSDKSTLSKPLNVEVTNKDQPDVELDYEKSEIITSNSNHESQKVPDECDSELPSDECQTERELSHEDSIDTSERLGSSDIIAEASVDETGLTEDSDPSVKRKIRKRMGMCRLGERKRILKEQQTRGQENEAGQVINEESVMMSDDLKKDGSIPLEEEGTTESEVSTSSFPTPCPLVDISVEEEQPDVQYGNYAQVRILLERMSSEQEITHEADNTIPSHALSDGPLEKVETECVEQRMSSEQEMTHESDKTIPPHALSDDPLEKVETKCVEHSTNENNKEMCDAAKAEIATEVAVDLAEACEEPTDVSARDVVVIKGPVEDLKDTAEASASTSEVASHFEELLVVGGNEMEVGECCPCERDMNTPVIGHTSEQCVELTGNAFNVTVSAPPVIDEIEDKCESLDCTSVAAAVAAENTVTREDSSVWSLSLPAAPPCGEDKDVQSGSEYDGLPSDAHEPHLSPAAEADPSSPLSVLSLTDSQLKNMVLSLDDLPVSEAACDLEDVTELVCGLTRDLAYLNQIVRDAQRKIGLVQQGRKPPRPQFRRNYGPPHQSVPEYFRTDSG